MLSARCLGLVACAIVDKNVGVTKPSLNQIAEMEDNTLKIITINGI